MFKKKEVKGNSICSKCVYCRRDTGDGYGSFYCQDKYSGERTPTYYKNKNGCCVDFELKDSSRYVIKADYDYLDKKIDFLKDDLQKKSNAIDKIFKDTKYERTYGCDIGYGKIIKALIKKLSLEVATDDDGNVILKNIGVTQNDTKKRARQVG
jgi:hypothetical protein